MGYLLGYDIGSSAVKASLLDAATGAVVAAATSPPGTELSIAAPRPGWAEQDPATWWEHVKLATAALGERDGVKLREVQAIGISYQMHGLVLVDQNHRVLRPAIIWCDSRAVAIGEAAFTALGTDNCLRHLLNSPGNFTASKLRWVREHEPEVYAKVHKAMLPGEYIAMMLTGAIVTTPSGLSEGVWWDYQSQTPAAMILDHYQLNPELLPEVRPVFANQGELTAQAAAELGLRPGTVVAYRAGDQPNNAFSLNVLEPGEIAATAGTSGVVYGVGDQPNFDPLSRVNTFVHVNHRPDAARYGILLCLNGTAILNRWLRDLLGADRISYEQMNAIAAQAPAGAAGLTVLPYGNGAERTLANREVGALVHGLNFNIHQRAHLLRAAQEGIVFALNYGVAIMREMGVAVRTVKAGRANLFLSPLFAQTFATVTGARVELYNTDGAQGAARGAGVGAGIYRDFQEAFQGLQSLQTVEPDPAQTQFYQAAYQQWQAVLAEKLT